jgi:hypothetical protein
MSSGTWAIFGILIVLGYIVAPTLLICGWMRWVRLPKIRTFFSILSLVGFILATASATLALLTVAYAQVHHFPFYDPLLLRILRFGFLLSLAGVPFGTAGVWRRNLLGGLPRRVP